MISYLSNLARSVISRWVGEMALIRFPPRIMAILIRLFVSRYRVDLSDVEEPLSRFATLNQFFTRRLKPEVRPIDRDEDAVVSPVDGLIQNWGPIDGNALIQAKGIDYTLERLLMTEMARWFIQGDYMTFYLSPRDCHLVFSPREGLVRASCSIPGRLFKVREPCVSRIPGLYTLNERLVTYLETEKGNMAVVMVGAFNVARMTVSYDDSIQTNRPRGGLSEKFYDQEIKIGRGEQLGTFNFGSTVILLFQKGMVECVPGFGRRLVKYGEKIARLL